MNKQLLVSLLAEIFDNGEILEPYPSWVGEVQIFENTVRVRIDDDHEPNKWFSISVSSA